MGMEFEEFWKAGDYILNVKEFRKRSREGRPLRRVLNSVQVATLAEEANRAYLVALRACGSASCADEAVQEAYAQLVRKPPVDQGYESSVAFFLKMVRRIAISQTRSRHRRKRREDVHAMIAGDTLPTAEDATINREALEALRQALMSIRSDEREAVSLCYEQGMTQRVASEILGVPEQTVSDRVRRGLKKLRSLLVAQGIAALAPLGAMEVNELGAALSQGGVPLAPSKLLTAVDTIVGGAAESARMGVQAATAKFSPILWIGLFLCGVLGVGWWVSGTKPLPQENAKVITRWDFSKGPPKDLSLASGHWKWQRDKGSALGGMVVSDFAELKLPASIPATPVVIKVDMVRVDGDRSQFRTRLTGGEDVRMWRKNMHVMARKKCVFRGYYLERNSVLCLDDLFCSVSEYQARKPDQRFILFFKYWKIRSIEVLHLEPGDLPVRFRDFEALKAKSDLEPQEDGEETIEVKGNEEANASDK